MTSNSTPAVETERLSLRRLSTADAPFILELLNDPSFINNIGDKGVRTLEDARGYILSGPMASYDKFGFGLWLVELRDSHTPIGMCGLLKREVLDDVDIGYAFLPAYWSCGYALESAAAVMSHAKEHFGLTRVVAVVNPDNERSIRLLQKVGFEYESMVKLSNEAEEIKLFGSNSKQS